MGFQPEEEPVERRSPLDVLSQRVGPFLATFLILWAAPAGLFAYSRIVSAETAPLAWHETATIVISAAAATVGIAVPLSVVVIEGIPMVFAHFIKLRHREEGLKKGREQGREQGREEGREQGRMEGRDEANRLWADWIRRKEEAETAGESFDEPPPNLQSSNGAKGDTPD